MKQFFKKTAKTLAVIMILTTFTNCENQSVDLKNQDASVTNAKKWLEKSNPLLSVLDYTKTIDWEHAIVTDGVKGKVVEVPILLKDNVVVNIEDDKSLKNYNRLLFILDAKDIYKVYQIIISDKKDNFDVTNKEMNFYKIKEDFEGLITVINSKNEIIDLMNISSKNLRKSSITNKIKTDGVVCVYYGYWDENDEFHAYYQVGCYGGGLSSGGGASYGSGGGKGDTQAEDRTVCYDSLDNLVNNSYAVSGSVSSEIIIENNNSRTKNYKWTIFEGPGYELKSSETAIQKKVVNSNPSLVWEWESLTHNSIYMEGFAIGGNISFNTVYAQPTIGKYNSIMDINYGVTFSVACSGSPVTFNGNYSASKLFNVND